MSSLELKRILESDLEDGELLVEVIGFLAGSSPLIKIKNAAKKKHVGLLGKESEFYAKLNGQFYTKRSIAEKCVQALDFEEYALLVEPSAGRGDFLEVFPKDKRTVALDIDPKHPDVIEGDFFAFTPEEEGKIAVIGNPPFGKNAALAVSFFRHAASFADTIAFILPRTFKKTSIINKLPKNFHLSKEVKLPETAFYIENGASIEDFGLRGVFQVWKKSDSVRKVIVEEKTHPDFSFVKKQDDHDFAVRRAGNRAGEVYDDTEKVAVQGNYFIKQNNEKVIDIFKKAWSNELDPKVDKDKKGFKYDSAGQSTISMPEMVKTYKKWKITLKNWKKT
jgi:hypothetical protein